jgi:hypothetical protein
MPSPNGTPLWEFDAADPGKVVSTANVVTAWTKTSGTAADANGTDATTPRIGRRTINGLPAIELDGASYIFTGAVTQANPVTIYMVVQTDDPQASIRQCLSTFAGGAHIIQTKAGAWSFYDGAEITASAKTVDKAPHLISAVFDGANSVLRVDGIQVAAGNVGTDAYSSSLVLVAGDGTWLGLVGLNVAFAGAHTTAQLVAEEQFRAQKWMRSRPVVLRSRSLPILKLRTLILGSANVTNANDTLSAAGGTGPSGTLARTNANDTIVAAGGTGPSGTLARTNANDTLAAAGGTGPSATLARTNANDSLAATGGTGPSGTLGTTNADDTLSAAGGTGGAGSLNYTNQDDTLSAEGGPLEPEPEADETRPGGRTNYSPSKETQDYWERERRRISTEAELAAILADDEEILVML